MNVKNSISEPRSIELERFLPYRLNVVAETVSRALSKIYARRYGMSVPEWRVIATLGQYDRMTAKQIGAHSHMHKTKVSRAAARLIDAELVLREPNVQDMREAHLTLSAKGREIYASIVPQALGFADQLFDGVNESERELLERLLVRLENRARQMEP